MNDFFDLNCFLLDPKLPKEASKDYVRTWLEYKAGGGVEDPDSSDGARYFYKELWGERLGITVRECRNTFSRRPSKYVQGDWMCSVWTTLKYALQQTYKENENGYVWFQKPDIEKTFTKNGDVTKRTFDAILKHFDEFGKVLKDKTVQEFIRAAYTPANLIIVPDGFNAKRNNRATEDYWDLTLKKYYQDKESLFYKPRNDDGKYDVATPFRKLLKKNQEEGDPLCLSPWIDEQGNPILLPHPPKEDKDNKDDKGRWSELVAEMTRRITCRRELMAQYIDRLQNE